MSKTTEEIGAACALSVSHAALDDLLGADLTRATGEELLAELRELERLRRRLPALEHRLVLEAEARGLPQAAGAGNTAAFLRELLRLEPGEASARVRAAEAGGARRSMTGQLVPAAYPLAGAVQGAGWIDPEQKPIRNTMHDPVAL